MEINWQQRAEKAEAERDGLAEWINMHSGIPIRVDELLNEPKILTAIARAKARTEALAADEEFIACSARMQGLEHGAGSADPDRFVEQMEIATLAMSRAGSRRQAALTKLEELA